MKKFSAYLSLLLLSSFFFIEQALAEVIPKANKHIVAAISAKYHKEQEKVKIIPEGFKNFLYA